MKKIALFGLILVLCINLIPINVYATENSYISTNEMDIQEQLTNNSNQVPVNRTNIERIVDEYDVPSEVSDYLQTLIKENVEVILNVPNVVNGGDTASVNSWSPVRQYAGYELKDWVVTVNNAYAMTSVKSSPGSDTFWDFILTAAVYVGEKMVDYEPVSLGLTAAEFFFGLESDEISPQSGDKIQAAPHYTAYQTFTYVSTDQGDVLGARTCCTYVYKVHWYSYCQSKNLTEQYYVNYNGKQYLTDHYNNRDAVAVQYHTTNAVIDPEIRLKLGEKYFIISY